MKLFNFLIAPAPTYINDFAWIFMRVGIGILTIGHGIPKIMGGIQTWRELGMWVYPLGIHFLPVMWGFLGACAEFFGGIALVLGIWTRVASFALVIMMFVATVYHYTHNDGYNVYSFPLSLIFVYFACMLIGGGTLSVDTYVVKRSQY